MADTAEQGTETKIGRPSTYSQELADKICEQLALGKSIRTVCASSDMPAMSTFFMWLRQKPGFSEQYARAKEEATEAMAEELQDIADDSFNVIVGGGDKSDSARVQAYKLRIDTRKWLMSKMKPKKYGDKLDVTSGGEKLPQPIYGGIQNVKTDDTNS